MRSSARCWTIWWGLAALLVVGRAPVTYADTPTQPQADLIELANLSQDPIGYAASLLDRVGGDPIQFAERLNSLVLPWTGEGATKMTSAWAAVADLNNDGHSEWIANIPGSSQICAANDERCLYQRFLCVTGMCPGTVVLLERADPGFAPLATIGTLEIPRLYGLEDLLGDGGTELLLSTSHGGASTAFEGLVVGRWDGTAWHDLAADPISLASTTVRVIPDPVGGPLDIVLHGGIATSVGGGPQRNHTRTYVWRNGAYHFEHDEPDPDPHAYFRMLDANAALTAGGWDRALRLASDAIANPSPTTDEWPQQPIAERIAAYASIEAILAHAEKGEADEVAALLAQLEASANQSNVVYINAARAFGATYQQTGDIAGACHVMALVVKQSWDEAEFYMQYGYAQERLSPEHVCPL